MLEKRSRSVGVHLLRGREGWQKIYFSEGSKAMPARPSARYRWETKYGIIFSFQMPIRALQWDSIFSFVHKELYLTGHPATRLANDGSCWMHHRRTCGVIHTSVTFRQAGRHPQVSTGKETEMGRCLRNISILRWLNKLNNNSPRENKLMLHVIRLWNC
jgi:hypothetical protein